MKGIRAKDGLKLSGIFSIYEGDRLIFRKKNTINYGKIYTTTQMASLNNLNLLNIQADGAITAPFVNPALPTVIHISSLDTTVNRWCPIYGYTPASDSIVYSAKLYKGEFGNTTTPIGYVNLGCHSYWYKKTINMFTLLDRYIYETSKFCGQPAVFVSYVDKLGGASYFPFLMTQQIDYGISLDTTSGYDYRIDKVTPVSTECWYINVNSVYTYPTSDDQSYYIVNGNNSTAIDAAAGSVLKSFSQINAAGGVTIDNANYDVLLVWEIQYG